MNEVEQIARIKAGESPWPLAPLADTDERDTTVPAANDLRLHGSRDEGRITEPVRVGWVGKA